MNIPTVDEKYKLYCQALSLWVYLVKLDRADRTLKEIRIEEKARLRFERRLKLFTEN